ncbi:Thiamin pyrophosphokinase, eukaryotic [Cordyceps fumosorosea ARSEF 2679]|uniref:Thiamine pyrophosphokinase n=1 Tax=Cordyceps fumosorosea (strain ARSEF 2679) TaxID=1081104 RepID=A0A168AS75_CORFA|nr:Thiamin pyrophosphokinase, eukaryotic [Cordyceps fumosorosea ARSEF 2679]OAA69126.1 Thiamin pyrophosphokinase, eukaryotic [Cordyceps fumosorosea ARSEF 2679]
MASSPAFEWHPARYMQASELGDDFALLVLNQPLKNGTTLRKLWNNSAVRVAADGGANRLYELSSFQGKFSNLQAIIGDLDSLSPTVRDFYSSQPQPAQVIHDRDQESSDFGKSVKWIRDSYKMDIVALGGIGGRVDQGVSQLHHLYLFQPGPGYDAGRIFLLSGSSLTFLLKAGRHRIHVREEDGEQDVFAKHVGILPLREPSRITTRGLEWDVTDWLSQIGGSLSTSNHILPDTKQVDIETTKDVLFTVALRQIDNEDEC